MRWFRNNIRHGSWIALIALAVNLALSFAHIHVIEGHRAALGQSHVAAVALSEGRQTPGRHDDGQADYLCPTCMAAAAMGSPLALMPPVLPLQFADAMLDRTVEPVRILVESPRAAFQSRGPPRS